MKTYTPPLGASIDQVFQAMCEIAEEIGESVRARFNGEALVVLPGDNFIELAAQWWSDAEAQNETWRKENPAEAGQAV